jgi:hypothetical protein
MSLNPKSNSQQFAKDLFSITHRATEDSRLLPTKRESASDPHPDKSNHLSWEVLAIWGFVIFTFAGLIFAFYVIWAKCNGR